MIRILTLLPILMYGCLAANPGSKQDGYKLVWADEFNQDGAPDPKNWQPETGFARNEELQWYQLSNAHVEKGMLVIEGRQAHLPNPGYEAGSRDWRKNRPFITYTAASIKTEGLQSWQFGRFEMRGRIPVDQGLWPAWWTLGEKGQWPSNGEIDIMEYYKGKLLANIACGTNTAYKAEWYSTTKSVNAEWAAKFHVWRMDWDEKAIALFVDDSLLNRVELSKLQNKDGGGINPFLQPHYMLLNLAIGGINGGEPGYTKFPVRFEIDYVRVYQKK